MTQVTLFTKPGCHLCEEVEAVIARVAKRRPFELVIRNIVENAEDFDRYQYLIPVVSVNGIEVTQYTLTEQQLEDALNAALHPKTPDV
ncbi:MAG TPA: glutaredoxin family protein [Tepidisphaeraceae bacterium]|jgi:hypothetical protein|nr:glutaredoxin family protein [Tepidisphaeraceae bacterium]